MADFHHKRSKATKKGSTKRRASRHRYGNAEILAALAAVDFVAIFDEPTAGEFIARLAPDVLAQGGEADLRLPDLGQAVFLNGDIFKSY